MQAESNQEGGHWWRICIKRVCVWATALPTHNLRSFLSRFVCLENLLHVSSEAGSNRFLLHGAPLLRVLMESGPVLERMELS